MLSKWFSFQHFAFEHKRYSSTFYSAIFLSFLHVLNVSAHSFFFNCSVFLFRLFFSQFMWWICDLNSSVRPFFATFFSWDSQTSLQSQARGKSAEVHSDPNCLVLSHTKSLLKWKIGIIVLLLVWRFEWQLCEKVVQNRRKILSEKIPVKKQPKQTVMEIDDWTYHFVWLLVCAVWPDGLLDSSGSRRPGV